MSALPAGHPSFTCNICGTRSQLPWNDMEMGRESGLCAGCGSTVRLRAIVRLLSLALFGKALAIADFPERPDLVGRGLSDWHGYAEPLAAKLGYINTFFHHEPRLDIADAAASDAGTLDFLIATDVFEHVAPPVERAFAGAYERLKPGGVMVFSVPFSIKIAHTEEHFPELHEYALHEVEGSFRLHNRTRDGREQVFDQLKFHGGAGATLEMRKFSLDDMEKQLVAAGFRYELHGEDAPEWGVVWTQGWSVPLLAWRPRY